MGIFDRHSSSVFRPRREGGYDVELGDAERHLLAQMLGQLRELLGTDSDAMARLFPPAYGDDEERNEGYAVLAGSELREGRLGALGAVEDTLDAEVLTEEQLDAWMRTINAVRLVLGTLLEVGEDDPTPAPDDPHAAMYATYEFFGFLLDQIVLARSA